MPALRPSAKVGIVLSGFAAALGAAWLVVALWQWFTPAPEAQASSGMHAFSDLALGVVVFSSLALMPLSLGLYWLRAAKHVWPVLAWGAVLYAMSGLLAVVVSGWSRETPGTVALLADARIGTMPLSALLALTIGAFAPLPRSRWMLACAALCDGVVFGGVMLVHFILPQLAR